MIHSAVQCQFSIQKRLCHNVKPQRVTTKESPLYREANSVCVILDQDVMWKETQ